MELKGKDIYPTESRRIFDLPKAQERYLLRTNIMKKPLYESEKGIVEMPSRFQFVAPRKSSLSVEEKKLTNYGFGIQNEKHKSDSTLQILAKMASSKLNSHYFLTSMELGRGVSGAVFLIRRKKDQKYYAAKGYLKKSTQNGGKNEKMITKIYTEIKILSKLHHENIIKTIDLVSLKDQFYAIMEYCPTNLFSLIKNQRLNKAEILEFFIQLGGAVSYLHNEIHIAHRDLKLENLCIGVEGQLKMVDFGSAIDFKEHNLYQDTILSYTHSSNDSVGSSFGSSISPMGSFCNSPSFVRVKGLCGSDPYIAPEVWVSVDMEQHNPHMNYGYDPRKIDIWSMAVIFISMTSAKFPWSIAKVIDSDFLLFEKTPKPVLNYFGVDKTLAKLILGMLQLNSDSRWDIDHVMNFLCTIRK